MWKGPQSMDTYIAWSTTIRAVVDGELGVSEAFSHFTSKAGVGGVIRDPYGHLLTAFSSKITAKHPVEAELIALQRGLLCCHDLRFPLSRLKGIA